MATLGLAAMSISGCSKGPAASAPRFSVDVVVMDCYTSTDVQVFIDGRPLALIAPAQRDDTTALCYDRPMAVGPRVQVRVRSQGHDRNVDLRPDGLLNYLVVSPDRAPYASLDRDRPALD